jgi:hypothetical protein
MVGSPLLSVAPGGPGDVPSGFRLEQNYPNPFNPETTIRYSLPRGTHVALSLFNALGQRVAELVHRDESAGVHEIRFDASALASGVYVYRLRAGEFVGSRKLLVIR